MKLISSPRCSCPNQCQWGSIISKFTHLYALIFGEWDHQTHPCHPPSAFEASAYDTFRRGDN